jgi:hypothetical protein
MALALPHAEPKTEPQLAARSWNSNGWKTPQTVVIDGRQLTQAKLRIKLKDPKYLAQLKNLKAQADPWLTQGPWTVTDKPVAPENGTIHDYLSQAPYWCGLLLLHS